MFNLDAMPILPGQTSGREVKTVNPEDLKSIGIQSGAFAMHINDVVEFENTDKPLVISQPVRNTPNSPLAYYVACTRNGKPSWLGIGILTRRDVEGKPIGEFQANALNYPSFLDLYSSMLSGKKITAKDTVTYRAVKYDAAGNRVEGETIFRTAPVIVYA